MSGVGGELGDSGKDSAAPIVEQVRLSRGWMIVRPVHLYDLPPP